MEGPVLIDTDVYSHAMISPARSAARGVPVDDWRAALAGRAVLISFQTRAELLSGFRRSNWGERRLDEAVRTLDDFPTVGVDEEVLTSYVALTVACRLQGHALQDKIHTGDRWVAACAMAKGMPLFAGDQIYSAAPGLQLLTTAAWTPSGR